MTVPIREKTNKDTRTWELIFACAVSLFQTKGYDQNTEFEDPKVAHHGGSLVIFNTKLFSATDGSAMGQVKHTELDDLYILSENSAKK